MKIGFRVFGQTISVATDDPQLWSFLLALRKIHVFEVQACDPGLPLETVPSLVHKRGASTRLTYDPATRALELVANWEDINASGTLENLLGQLAGLACFDAGLVPVHGGAISVAGGMYLFVGGSGAGKSSLCLAMMSKFGARWEANDYLCLGRGPDEQIYVQQVDDYFDFRNSMLNNLGEVLPPSVSRLVDATQTADPWAKSPAVPLSILRPPSDGGRAVPIKGIIFPVTGSGSPTAVGRLAERVGAANLLREIAWPIRGIGGFFLGNGGTVLAPSVSIIPTGGWQLICDLVTDLISSCTSWAAIGSVESLPQALYSTVVVG